MASTLLDRDAPPAAAPPPVLLRLLGSRPSTGLQSWLACLVVTAIGGFLRFWRLDHPHALVFDETYYVKQGVSMLKAGYELRWPDKITPSADYKFAHGTPDVFLKTPDFVVHPPAGKWMLAFGEWLFGTSSSWGWRFSAAVCGTLSILMLARIARRIFGSTLLGVVAGLLLALDGHHFVHSRTGLLDIFVMFWALAGFGCLVLDRDQARARLAGRVTSGASLLGFGPGLGIRWWRLAAGVCLGLCAATKWSGLYFLIVFGLMSVLWDVGARRAAGARYWFLGAIWRDGISGALLIVPAALATYLASWTGWFLSTDGYDRQWGAQHPSTHFGWVPNGLRALWKYHQEQYNFNINLHSFHQYKANPWSWIVMGRPTAFWYEGPKIGQKGCAVSQCSEAITALGNPVVWWGGTVAVGLLVFRWLLARDWRAGAILAGLLGGYAPWFLYQNRTIYNFYAVAFVPWVVLALTYALGLLLGPTHADPRRRLLGAVAAGAVVVAAAMAFVWFYPIYVAEVIPQVSWSDRMWLPSWI
jgi:dolichyl-phosphate-mannose-protein mannosyltransferase